jgi:hypothetical protein
VEPVVHILSAHRQVEVVTFPTTEQFGLLDQIGLMIGEAHDHVRPHLSGVEELASVAGRPNVVNDRQITAARAGDLNAGVRSENRVDASAGTYELSA